MADIAFLGNPAIKAQALTRLRGHIAADTFVFFPAWEDGKANVIGALVEADDKQAFADQYGYPIALAMALERIVNAFRTLNPAQEFVAAWLERTPVGADLSLVVPQIMAFLLDHPEIVALAARHGEVERCRQAILALHRRVIAGESVDRKEWKSARLAAVAVSDTASEDESLHKASLIIEAAAWPATMRTVLHDTLGAWGGLEIHQMMKSIGWTHADESRVFKIREQAEVDGRMAELNGLDRVLALLDADDPELARGFRQRLEHFGTLGGIYRTVGWKAIDLFEAAPALVEPGEAVA